MAKVLKKKNGDYVIINDLYEEIPVKHVDVLYPFHNNIATFRVTVNKEKMFGYMNTSGERITQNVYEHAEDFGEKYGLVKNGNYQNLIDKSGKELFEWKYTSITPFIKDTFIVMNAEGYYGLIDINGKVILKFIYKDHLQVTCKAQTVLMKWPAKQVIFLDTKRPSW